MLLSHNISIPQWSDNIDISALSNFNRPDNDEPESIKRLQQCIWMDSKLGQRNKYKVGDYMTAQNFSGKYDILKEDNTIAKLTLTKIKSGESFVRKYYCLTEGFKKWFEEP